MRWAHPIPATTTIYICLLTTEACVASGCKHLYKPALVNVVLCSPICGRHPSTAKPRSVPAGYIINDLHDCCYLLWWRDQDDEKTTMEMRIVTRMIIRRMCTRARTKVVVPVLCWLNILCWRQLSLVLAHLPDNDSFTVHYPNIQLPVEPPFIHSVLTMLRESYCLEVWSHLGLLPAKPFILQARLTIWIKSSGR